MAMNNGTQRRVVVTGMGAVTPIGLTVDEFWVNALAGKSGVGLITSFDVSDYDTKIAAEVKGFDPLKFLEKKESNRMDLFARYAMAAATMAMQHSGLKMENENNERIGVIFGSGIGGMRTWQDQLLTVYE